MFVKFDIELIKKWLKIDRVRLYVVWKSGAKVQKFFEPQVIKDEKNDERTPLFFLFYT